MYSLVTIEFGNDVDLISHNGNMKLNILKKLILRSNPFKYFMLIVRAFIFLNLKYNIFVEEQQIINRTVVCSTNSFFGFSINISDIY